MESGNDDYTSNPETHNEFLNPNLNIPLVGHLVQHQTTESFADQNINRELDFDLQSVASLDSSFRDSGMGTMSTSSKTTTISLGGVTPVARQELLLLLGGNDALNFLFAEAVNKMDKEKFIRNVRRLLSQYALDLTGEARSERSKDAANMVRHNSK